MAAKKPVDWKAGAVAVGNPQAIGTAYIIRTVTYHYTGRLKAVAGDWLVLDTAAWIADSGRWAGALANGELSEVEPYPGELIINRAAVVDMAVWTHALPTKQK